MRTACYCSDCGNLIPHHADNDHVDVMRIFGARMLCSPIVLFLPFKLSNAPGAYGAESKPRFMPRGPFGKITRRVVAGKQAMLRLNVEKDLASDLLALDFVFDHQAEMAVSRHERYPHLCFSATCLN